MTSPQISKFYHLTVERAGLAGLICVNRLLPFPWSSSDKILWWSHFRRGCGREDRDCWQNPLSFCFWGHKEIHLHWVNCEIGSLFPHLTCGLSTKLGVPLWPAGCVGVLLGKAVVSLVRWHAPCLQGRVSECSLSIRMLSESPKVLMKLLSHSPWLQGSRVK